MGNPKHKQHFQGIFCKQGQGFRAVTRESGIQYEGNRPAGFNVSGADSEKRGHFTMRERKGTPQVTSSVQMEGVPLLKSKDCSPTSNQRVRVHWRRDGQLGKFHGGSLQQFSSDCVCFLCHQPRQSGRKGTES